MVFISVLRSRINLQERKLFVDYNRFYKLIVAPSPESLFYAICVSSLVHQALYVFRCIVRKISELSILDISLNIIRLRPLSLL